MLDTNPTKMAQSMGFYRLQLNTQQNNDKLRDVGEIWDENVETKVSFFLREGEKILFVFCAFVL